MNLVEKIMKIESPKGYEANWRCSYCGKSTIYYLIGEDWKVVDSYCDDHNPIDGKVPKSNSLIEKIMNVDKAVRELYDEMIAHLNQDDMDYDIEFQGEKFSFHYPADADDKAVMDAHKHEASVLLLRDALERLCTIVGQDETANDLRNTWINIANLQRSTMRETIVSEVVSEEYAVDEGTSKDLDYDSIYIQAQRKDLSDDDKWNLLLNFITVQGKQKDTAGEYNLAEPCNAGTHTDGISSSSDC